MIYNRVEKSEAYSSRVSLARKDELVSPDLKQKAFDPQNGGGFLSSKKQSKQSAELFPGIRSCRPLPQKGSDVDFDTPSFRAPRTSLTQKPTLPLPEIQNEEPIPQGETSSKIEKDILTRLPHQGGAILAKLIGMITDYQTVSQQNQLEVFKATSDHLEEVRQKQLELVLNQIKQRKDSETWSYRGEMMNYLGAATGIIAGTGMIGSSVMSGGTSAIPGIKVLAGSLLSIGATIAGKRYNEKKISTAVALGGAILSGFGMWKAVKDFEAFTKLFGFANTTVGGVMQTAIAHRQGRVKAEQFGISAKNIKLQFKREDNEQTMRKIVGEMNSSKESTNLIGAATKALRTEDEIKSRIALGSKY